MLLCLPYVPALPFYPDLVNALRRHSYPDHTLGVLTFRSDDDGAFKISEALADAFGHTIRGTFDDLDGTPIEKANRMFTKALDLLDVFKSRGNDAPMIYMDPSWEPNSPRWLDTLNDDYAKAGSPKVFARFQKKEPPITQGPVIFSAEYRGSSELMPFLSKDAHWRHFLAWELFRSGVEAEAIGDVVRPKP